MGRPDRVEPFINMSFLKIVRCSVFGRGSSEVWRGVDEDHQMVLRRSFGFVWSPKRESS